MLSLNCLFVGYPATATEIFDYKQVHLDKLFLSKPCSLALAKESPLRMDEPQYEGIKRLFLRMMLFYSKQSQHIRAANVIYRRIVSQVDKPAIYDGNPFCHL